MGIFDRLRGDHMKIHVVIRGRIGDAWQDIDEYVRVPLGTTLAKLIEVADEAGIPLRDAITNSPHLREAIMLNGERCPVAENQTRELHDGDELYLLAPITGG